MPVSIAVGPPSGDFDAVPVLLTAGFLEVRHAFSMGFRHLAFTQKIIEYDYMSKMTTVTEALRNFSDYVNRVAYRGERFVLVRGGKPVAELAPVATGVRLGDLPELLASLPRLSDGEAKEFADDVDRARSELDKSELRDPWGS
jgi:antitoxin (DNA-binding transcriptional repressor) of toxin-antitoxin stability system